MVCGFSGITTFFFFFLMGVVSTSAGECTGVFAAVLGEAESLTAVPVGPACMVPLASRSPSFAATAFFFFFNTGLVVVLWTPFPVSAGLVGKRSVDDCGRAWAVVRGDALEVVGEVNQPAAD